MEDFLYNSIGAGYNRTRSADPVLAEKLFSLLAARQKANYLDAGCGTGNYTAALAAAGCGRFYGVDPSAVMLAAARKKSRSVFWTQGAAENLPFGDSFFGGALASLTVHHWQSLEKGFAEIGRVLEPGGRFVFFTSFPEQMKGYWLNHYFPQMMKDSMAAMPERRQIQSALDLAGLDLIEAEKYFVQPDLRDLFLYSGKHRPELYLDARVRRGISSFSVLAHRREVESGLEKLSQDLASGDFAQIAKKYENDSGDYCFIVAVKPS